MATNAFDPNQHLIIVNGAAYLPVAWRLAWLREDAPASKIDTMAVEVTEKSALMKAIVQVITKDGEVSAHGTGYGYQTAEGFASFVEAAETKAIGRALAVCGYGTQFTGSDFADATGDVLADAPIKGGFTPPTRPANPQPAQFDNDFPETPSMPADWPQDDEDDGDPGLDYRQRPPGEGMTKAHIDFFYQLADKHNVRDDEIRNQIRKMFGIEPPKDFAKMLDVLTKWEGTRLTNEWLKPKVGFVDKQR